MEVRRSDGVDPPPIQVLPRIDQLDLAVFKVASVTRCQCGAGGPRDGCNLGKVVYFDLEKKVGSERAAALLPLSTLESDKVTPFRGGYPEPLARPRSAALWYQSYVQTYLERDVRQISQIRDLSVFRRFLALVASRCGQLLGVRAVGVRGMLKALRT